MLEGLVGLLVTVVAGALLLRWVGPAPAFGVSVLVLIPYLTLVIAGARLLERLSDRPRRPRPGWPGPCTSIRRSSARPTP